MDRSKNDWLKKSSKKTRRLSNKLKDAWRSKSKREATRSKLSISESLMLQLVQRQKKWLRKERKRLIKSTELSLNERNNLSKLNFWPTLKNRYLS